MNKRRLPIGIQNFRKIREQNCYYVDKTEYIRTLLDGGTHYFLSRPRRFGKSLFLDTLKELFEGNEPLFEGLYIHGHWDWEVRHPVLRLDFSSGNYQGPDDLQKEVTAQLNAFEDEAEISPRDESASARLRHLIKVLHERSGQRVVLLVDEYDKPIPGRAGGAGGRPGQSRLIARSVFDRKVFRRAYPLHVHYWRQQILQSEYLLRPQQPHRHHH